MERDRVDRAHRGDAVGGADEAWRDHELIAGPFLHYHPAGRVWETSRDDPCGDLEVMRNRRDP
jgi:hypothetical protein